MEKDDKRLSNLKPIRKGDLSEEELKKRQRNGGKKSGEVRRAKRDARESARYILGLAAKGATLEQLEKIGADKKDDLTNMEVLQARLFVQATSGDMEAAKMLLKIAGYDAEENRKERESLSSDRRKDLELDAKMTALGNGQDSKVSMAFDDEGGSGSVMIYLPEVDKEENCEVDEPDPEEE